MTGRRPLAALVLAFAALAAGCGGGGSGDAKTRTTIERNWETFFDASGSASTATRAGLLQNGALFASLIRRVAANPLSKQLSAKVSNVDVTGPNAAKVKYTLYLGKTAVLKNVEGTAVRENGAWKVGYASFCQLLALQGAAPKSCPAPSR